MTPQFTNEDQRFLHAMKVDLGDPRVKLRPEPRLADDKARYENMKHEAALVIGQLSLQLGEAKRQSVAWRVAAAILAASLAANYVAQLVTR